MKFGYIDPTTGEALVRDATPEELGIREAEIAQWAKEKEERIAKAKELRTLKISAYTKLGLTEAEIEALLPTPQPKNTEPLGGN